MIKFLLLPISNLLFFLTSCHVELGGENLIKNDSCLNIKIRDNIDQSLQIDSIYSEFNTISLETNNECLISQIKKILFYNDLIFIQDKIGKLFVFDIRGKYLYRIGRKGKRPGEYIELRDFDIDKEGNVYILDFRKILKYSYDGQFINTVSFNLLSRASNKIYCNPFELIVNRDGNFYIWGGSLGIDNNLKSRYFSLYEMTKEGEIINKYLPLRHYNSVGLPNFRLRHYKDITLIKPVFGCDTIYSIGVRGIEARYNIDFGSKSLKIAVPNRFDLNFYNKFLQEADQLYYHSIDGFIETNDWIYFMFIHKTKIYNVYYSKILKKSFLVNCRLDAEFIVPQIIYSCYQEKLISTMYPDYIIELISRYKKSNKKNVSISEKKFIERYSHIKITDNPILVTLLMKQY